MKKSLSIINIIKYISISRTITSIWKLYYQINDMSLKYLILIIGILPKSICDEKRFNVNIQKLTRKNKGSESETERARLLKLKIRIKKKLWKLKAAEN